MKLRTRWLAATGAVLLLYGAWKWHDDRATRFLAADTAAFVATFGAPAEADSAATRAELDELLALQATRSAEEMAAARADRKTEVRRFYGALGLDAGNPPQLPRVEKLAERVEDDVRIYVRAVKEHFRRLRPYEIEPRLKPCIDNVRGDLSYPSGHSAFGWAMAGMLSDLVPEKRAVLETRASSFARQRAVCGVHFPSDLAAGRQAAERVLLAIRATPEYRAESAAAAAELRGVLRLASLPPGD
ncbi:MAG: phosphatase [Steroidobacteraceae bacterium]|jgi:acid phosphatase (class A)|nr:phosphatase [Steroidobacteraceae bacterium]